MIPTPITKPVYPATVVIKTDSSNTSPMTEAGVAPSAFRIPISLVRSFTRINIILLTPTIPAIKVPIPMIQTNILMAWKIFIVRIYSVSMLKEPIALVSFGSKLCLSAIFCLTFSVIASASSVVLTIFVVTAKVCTRSAPLKIRCAVVTGM